MDGFNISKNKHQGENIELPTQYGWHMKAVADNILHFSDPKIKALKKKGPMSI